MKKINLFILFFPLLISAQIELSNIFSDGMVLQRNSNINIWGKSNSNESIKINVSWNSQVYKTKSDKKGNWIIKIPTNNSRETHNITIKTKTDSIEINDVLLGEVWFASGQSNMQMNFKGYSNEPIKNAQYLINKSNNSNIRLLSIPRIASKIPLENFDSKWEISNKTSVLNFSVVAYSFAIYINETLNVPVGIIHTSWGGTPAEAWTEKSFLENNFEKDEIKNHAENKWEAHEPSFLYNGMINPLINYTVKGSLWYQGESNVPRAKNYAKLMKVMVESWRYNWNQNIFPFYYVQIAPFKYDGPENINSALLRESQLNAMSLIENSGMVVTSDLGDLNSIHPSNKIEIGQRLAYWALNKTYGFDEIIPSGPIPVETKIDGSKVEITFDYAKNGFFNYNGNLRDFDIAGDDNIFYPAVINSINNKLIISSPNVKIPKMVRYGWKNYFESSLFNLEGLPASSFFIRKL